MDYSTEIYDTVINGMVITFHIKYLERDEYHNTSAFWRGYGDYKFADGDSAESAALNLVKLLEQ